jgi:hypothetical protein
MRRLTTLGLALLLVIPLTGCAKAAQTVAEKAAENAIEQQSGGNADVDISNDGGTVQVQTDQGSATFGGGEIPDSIDVDLPSGGNVVSSIEADSGASVMVEYPDANFDDIVATLQSWVDAQPDDYTAFTSSGGGIQNQAWGSDTTAISVQTCTTTSGGQGVCVSVQQSNN